MLFVMQVYRFVKSTVKCCGFMTGFCDRLISDYGAIGGMVLNGGTEVLCLEMKTEILQLETETEVLELEMGTDVLQLEIETEVL